MDNATEIESQLDKNVWADRLSWTNELKVNDSKINEKAVQYLVIALQELQKSFPSKSSIEKESHTLGEEFKSRNRKQKASWDQKFWNPTEEYPEAKNHN